MAGSSSSYNFDPIFIDPDEGVGSAQEKLSPKKHSAVKTQSIRRKFLWQSFKFIAKWLISFLIIGVIALFLLVKLSDHIISDLPDPRALADPRENVSIRVKSATGDDIGIRGSYFAGEVKLSDVSPHLLNAIMAVEDRNFYTHFGFDPAGILRALLKNMQSGRVVQGASTLTQQLAKDLFLDAERSYARKIKELLYAIKIESTYSKDRIFELYLNRVYLGAGLYGVKAAAERYFGKHPRDLNIAESALIAGLLKAPSRYAPTNNPVRSHERAAVAVEAMYRTGYITQSERDYAVAFPAEFQMSVLGKGFGYVADRITDIVPRLIGSLDRDVIVTTTINSHLQAISDVLVDDFVSNMGTQKGFQQAAFIALDDNGAVLAMTGGKSYAETPFNRTMQAFRQPGSAFKPFVYAAAFERGLKPWDVVVDEDISFGNYRPTNYKNKYEGAMSARTAFAKSVNTVAVKLAYRSGIKNVKAIAEKAGIVSSIKPYLSMSLGAFEVTPLELTSAYIPFFNGGYGVSPHLVTKITTPDGEILFEQNSNSLNRSERIYSPQTIHHMKDIFHAVTSYGTGRKARLETVPTFGKTGTTSGYKDAWFVGHAGNQNGITAGIWVGNDDYKATDEATGGGVAAILWKNILESYYDIEPHSEPNFIVQDYSKPGPLEQIIQSYDSENQQADTPIAHIIQDHENSSATVVAAQPAIETQKPREYNDAHIESLLLKLER